MQSQVICTNQVQKGGGVCVTTHCDGAKMETMQPRRSTNQAKKGGVCFAHGAKMKHCSFKGCANQSIREEFVSRMVPRGKIATLRDATCNYARKGGVVRDIA